MDSICKLYEIVGLKFQNGKPGDHLIHICSMIQAKTPVEIQKGLCHSFGLLEKLKKYLVFLKKTAEIDPDRNRTSIDHLIQEC